MSWQELADQVLEFARTQPEQIIVIHVSSDHDSLSAIEDAWDQVCQVHTERTEGTDLFQKHEVHIAAKATNYMLNLKPVAWGFPVSFYLQAH